MDLAIFEDKQAMGEAAAACGAESIRQAIATRGAAKIIVATGASQFEVLESLAKAPDIAWHKVTAFHLDEYVGLPITHPASFRKYLWERFVSKLPLPLAGFHYLNGEVENGFDECERVGAILREHPIDCAFVGIGENGHLAFNDPPADFETEQPYLVVELDEACRQQQAGEGWFASLENVPKQAISMSVRQIMKSQTIVCTVPDARKANAVQASVEGPVTPDVPASILQEHACTKLFLDQASAQHLNS